MKTVLRYIACLCMLSVVLSVAAAPVYVTDKLSVGLHEDKTADSPIVKVVTSGTRLELVKQEDNLSFVSDPGGTTGWVDNTYLNEAMPASEQLRQISARNATLEAQLRDLRNGNTGETPGTANNNRLASEFEDLQKQYNSEKLRVGELQVTVSELRKRLGSGSDVDELYEQIDSLRELNKDLEIQLANTLGDTQRVPDSTTGMATVAAAIDAGQANMSWKTITATVLILLVLGVCGGIYLMDYLNRRRHGGFRI